MVVYEEEEEEISWESRNIEVNWLDLPDHILSLIFDRLNLEKHIIRCGAVCHSWRSVYKYISKSRSRRLPLLMLATEFNQTDDQTRSFYNLANKAVCNSKVRIPQDRDCRGSSHGWVATVCMEKNKQVSLINPFLSANNEIFLPPLTAFEYTEQGGEPSYSGYLRKVVLSANPTYNPSYVAVAIYCAYNGLAFFKPGDKAWTSLDQLFLRDVIYYRDQFHVVVASGEVFAFDFNHSDSNPKVSKVAPPTELATYKRYLVESCGELLQVLRLTDEEESEEEDASESEDEEVDTTGSIYYNVGFLVYKFDPVGYKWILLDNIDGRIIFVGDNSSFSVSASDYPSCKPNSVYFTDDHIDGYSHDMGVYSFDDDKVKPHYPTKSKMIFLPPIWVEPPLHGIA